MKRIFFAIFFILISVLIGLYGLKETEKNCNRMIVEIEEATKENKVVIESSSHQRKVDFYKTTTELKALWEENSDFFYFFFDNDDIKTIETNIEKLPEHSKNGELEASYLCLVECLEELEYLKNNTRLTFSNIF